MDSIESSMDVSSRLERVFVLSVSLGIGTGLRNPWVCARVCMGCGYGFG